MKKPRYGFHRLARFLGSALLVGTTAAAWPGMQAVAPDEGARPEPEIVPLGLVPAAGPFPIPVQDGRFVFYAVEEAQDGAVDHNGDGDVRDQVLFRLDLEAGTSVSLGLAGSPLGSVPGYVFLSVDEVQQGADFDGDGRFSNCVLGIWETASLYSRRRCGRRR